MAAMPECTLGEIVAEFPAAAPVFEKYRIDYCCGGRRRFLDTCRQAGLDPAGLEAEIAASSQSAVPPPLDWNTASLRTLTGYIIQVDHSILRKELAALGEMLPKYADTLWKLHRTLARLTQDLNAHMNREENVLFPAIVHLEAARQANAAFPRPAFGSICHPISMIEQEHRIIATIVRDTVALVRQSLSSDPDDEALQTLRETLEPFEIRLYRNFHLENNILFPRAARLEIQECRS